MRPKTHHFISLFILMGGGGLLEYCGGNSENYEAGPQYHMSKISHVKYFTCEQFHMWNQVKYLPILVRKISHVKIFTCEIGPNIRLFSPNSHVRKISHVKYFTCEIELHIISARRTDTAVNLPPPPPPKPVCSDHLCCNEYEYDYMTWEMCLSLFPRLASLYSR